MNKPTTKSLLNRPYSERNNKLYDKWSLMHVVTGALFGWLVSPAVAIPVMLLWEPLEVLVLSPVLARFGIDFGFESLRNSLSDIFFDAVGFVLGYYVLAAAVAPPFKLF